MQGMKTALLSQEGSGIAKRIPRGVVPKPHTHKIRFLGTTPALRATPPDSGGEIFRLPKSCQETMHKRLSTSQTSVAAPLNPKARQFRTSSLTLEPALRQRPSTPSVVVVNSCTVTDEADRDVRHLIRRIATRNPETRIIVTGCYAQRAPEELAGMPGVEYVVGNSHKPLVGRLTLNVLDEDFTSTGRAEVFCSDIFLEHELQPRTHSGSGGRTRAIVKVQDGCNANCSFCIIPSVRGRSRSMAPDLVLAEVRSLVERGYKEIVLSGIHLGTYGRDLDFPTSLLDLIHRLLDDIPELARIRLSSIEPLEVTPDYHLSGHRGTAIGASLPYSASERIAPHSARNAPAIHAFVLRGVSAQRFARELRMPPSAQTSWSDFRVNPTTSSPKPSG